MVRAAQSEDRRARAAWARAGDRASQRIDFGDVEPLLFRGLPPGVYTVGGRRGVGLEEPRRRVRLQAGLHLGVFPVTQGLFTRFAEAVGIEHRFAFGGQGLLPAEGLDWWQAMEFCGWLNETRRVPEGLVAGLPNEWLWEVACRAGGDTEFAGGDGIAALDEMGWHDDNAGDRTHPVGAKVANAWGLHDMHGNVHELCSNTWEEAEPRRQPPVLAAFEPRELEAAARAALDRSPAARTVRGACYHSSPSLCQSSFRFSAKPEGRMRDQGFRVALFPSAEAPAGARVGKARGVQRDRAGQTDFEAPPERSTAWGALNPPERPEPRERAGRAGEDTSGYALPLPASTPAPTQALPA
jgi:formylglycine-generating enzyme required for sulfatase activity